MVVLDGRQVREPLEQVRQIGVRFDAVGLGGLDQGVQVGARHGTVDGVTEEPAFATEHEGAKGVLAAVVVDGHFALREEGGQLRPLTEGVVHGFPEPALRQHLGAQRLEPGVEARHDRGRVRASNLKPLFGCQRMFPIPQRALDQVELADEIQRAPGVAAVTRGCLARLVELAARMSHAAGVHELQFRGDGGVGLIAVAEENPPITLQQPLRHRPSPGGVVVEEHDPPAGRATGAHIQ